MCIRDSSQEAPTSENTTCVVLVKGESPEGVTSYAYVALQADKLEPFMKAQEEGIFHPDDYGVIVQAGEGDPTPEVQQYMEENYGFNHAAIMDIPSDITSDQVEAKLKEMKANTLPITGSED